MSRKEIRLDSASQPHNSFLLQRSTIRSNENISHCNGSGVFNAISPGVSAVIQNELTSKSSMSSTQYYSWFKNERYQAQKQEKGRV